MKKLATIVTILSVCAGLWALENLYNIFPAFPQARITALRNGETIEALTSDGQSVAAIAPRNSQGHEVAAAADEMTKGFSIAGVSFIPYPENYKKLSQEEREVTLYNILRSISTQKGITYISHLAGEKPTTLFEDSYMISDPENYKSKIADPVSTEVPSSFSCYSYQKDNRFGKNVYKLNYTIKEGDFLMDISNYTKMKYMGFSCVPKGDLHMYLEVVESSEGFVLYTIATVDREPQVRILFITVDLPSAFMRRITAIKDWFTTRINSI